MHTPHLPAAKISCMIGRKKFSGKFGALGFHDANADRGSIHCNKLILPALCSLGMQMGVLRASGLQKKQLHKRPSLIIAFELRPVSDVAMAPLVRASPLLHGNSIRGIGTSAPAFASMATSGTSTATFWHMSSSICCGCSQLRGLPPPDQRRGFAKPVCGEEQPRSPMPRHGRKRNYKTFSAKLNGVSLKQSTVQGVAW